MTTHSNSKLPDKVPINMTKYPHLQALGKDAGPIVSGVFEALDNMIEAGHHEVSKKVFGIPIQDLTAQLLEAMFDHRGIMNTLPDQENADFISEAYTYQLNPLHAAFDSSTIMDRNFKPVTFEQKFGMDKRDFTVKDFIQSLLFYSYYGKMDELAKYLFTNDYSLFDNEKHENIDKLIAIRPALTYQQAIGIMPGKLIPGTGFFDCGDAKGLTTCTACKSPKGLILLDELSVCTECKGGYRV
jgi:hypothetical protein